MKKFLFLLLLSISSFAQKEISIIPKPESIKEGLGHFKITNTTKIVFPAGNNANHPIAVQLAHDIKNLTGLNLAIVANASTNKIAFILKNSLKKEAYEININATSGVSILASNEIGFFYAYQTLMQMMPNDVYKNQTVIAKQNLSLPVCTIADAPRFEYRGLMLDVSRHFFSVDFIKHLMDVMAVYKLNIFHWHLTDDQGWRIEIKKYPLLTEIGSSRKETMLGIYSDKKYDGIPYSGYYTQEQIKVVVKYAKSKFITIVPEIEMPGHALAALAAYPELGCTNDKYEVGTKWGVEERVFCPNEKTFSFLEDVLTEVMTLFPGEYIHIGGDECPKTAWKASALCQDLIKKEGLKDEHELQSYFIKRINKFVTSKGKKIIGWDEILEGGLSANATVMSWRGESGGIEAAKKHHDVIMSPNSYVYLDYYQGNPKTEPLAIGGFLPLEKTYSYEPIASSLNADETKYIKGIQGNLWTEYVNTNEKAEYMFFPRAIAIAEIGWSEKTKNFNDFSARLSDHFDKLNNMNVNYSKASNTLTFETVLDKNNFPSVRLSSNDKKAIIRYSVDGSQPTSKSTIFDKNINGNDEFTVYADLYNKENLCIGAEPLARTYVFSKSTAKKYTLGSVPKKYFGQQVNSLTDGIRGNELSLTDWVGFEGENLYFTLDLLQKMNFKQVSIGFLNDYANNILSPKKIVIAVSNDNVNYTEVKNMPLGDYSKVKSVSQLNIAVGVQNARYIKIIAQNVGNMPNDDKKPAFLMVDEISVR